MGLLGKKRPKKTSETFSKERGLDTKRNSGLILVEDKSLKRNF